MNNYSKQNQNFEYCAHLEDSVHIVIFGNGDGLQILTKDEHSTVYNVKNGKCMNCRL